MERYFIVLFFAFCCACSEYQCPDDFYVAYVRDDIRFCVPKKYEERTNDKWTDLEKQLWFGHNESLRFFARLIEDSSTFSISIISKYSFDLDSLKKFKTKLLYQENILAKLVECEDITITGYRGFTFVTEMDVVSNSQLIVQKNDSLIIFTYGEFAQSKSLNKELIRKSFNSIQIR